MTRYRQCYWTGNGFKTGGCAYKCSAVRSQVSLYNIKLECSSVHYITMTDHTSTDDDRLACIKDITTLFGKLEIEDCRSLVKKAMEMIESTPVSKAVKDALISAGLKNV